MVEFDHQITGDIHTMSLGEKIFKLRKEKGLSQEALAEQIGTTRQAISKWENNQGFPETEKLLQLSNIFEVSTDFLLKDDKLEKSADEKGYYVSREMAKGYIAVAIPCTVLFIIGILILGFTGKGYMAWSDYHSFVFLGFSIGLLGFVYSAGVMEAYELLVKNEEYSTRLSFRLKRKLKEKFDKI